MSDPHPISTSDLKIFTLKNSLGTEIQILNLGASLFNFYTNDRDGNRVNILVGPAREEDYLSSSYKEENRCFGSSVGRYAGRISHGKFTLQGKTYDLFEEDGVHLHGGKRGFQYKLWDLQEKNEKENSITLGYLSKDGEEGYPGNLDVRVKYTLTATGELLIEYTAQTDKTTVINLTNHAYYNLNGTGGVSDHELYVAANSILEVDKKQRPTGNFISLERHSKNFSLSKPIGIKEIDDTYVLDKSTEVKAKLYAPKTGIEMTVTTNQPAIVIFVPEENPEKWEYKNEPEPFPSICLETQNFPDAPNHQHFPSAILNPGEIYKNHAVFKVGIKREE